MTPAGTDTATLDEATSTLAPAPAEAAPVTEIVAELLVEEISIDGMCGVY